MQNYSYAINESKTNDLDKDDNNSHHPETIVIVNCVLNAPLMLISIVGNALVLAAILRTPSIRSTSMVLLGFLAATDLLVGFIVQPIYIAQGVTKHLFLYHLREVLGYSICSVSLCTITAISVDRLIALHYHMRYATFVTESRVIYTVVMIWAINVLLSCIHFWNDPAFNIMIAVITGICLVISTFSYIRIYGIVRQHQSQLSVQQNAAESSDTRKNVNCMARLKKSALNTFLFYIVLVICYFPTYILSILYGIPQNDWITEWEFAYTLIFMNSSINPLLCCWRIRELRAAVVMTAKQLFC